MSETQESMKTLLTPDERQQLLRALKKGPGMDRGMVGAYALAYIRENFKKDPKAFYDKYMARWREENRGKARVDESFLY